MFVFHGPFNADTLVREDIFNNIIDFLIDVTYTNQTGQFLRERKFLYFLFGAYKKRVEY